MRALMTAAVLLMACSASLGHSNNDLSLPFIPAFSSIDKAMHQLPCESDGVEAQHCCFACAVGIPIDKSVAMKAAKAI
jgi:hypothetical protein